MFYSIFINSQVEKTALIRGVLQNQNFIKQAGLISAPLDNGIFKKFFV